jgi:hypothetical protein
MGDFDGDGDLDLLVTGNYSGGTATLYENEGDEDGDLTNFSEVASLNGVQNGDSAVGDFDGDGDLDLLVVGSTNGAGTETATIYENTGQNGGSGTLDGTTFQAVGAGLTGVNYSAVSVGDFDGDGDLDLLVTGYYYAGGPNQVATIYENTGQNAGSGTLDGTTFQAVGGNLTGVENSATSVGDFDGDGDLDLLVTGNDGSYSYGETATIYENTGQNGGSGTLDGTTFQAVGAGLTGVQNGATSVGDFDGDGDLDLLITGGFYGGVTTIYENTGQNGGSGTLDGSTFQDVGASLTGVENSATSVGDFDGDGDLDLLVTGYYYSYQGPTRIATIYENTGQNGGSGTLDGNTFQEAGAGLTGVEDGALSVGDLDEDGDLDYVVTGNNGSGPLTQVYENQSTATLTVTGQDGTGNDTGWRMLSFPGPIQLQDLEDDFNFDFQSLSQGNVVHVWDATGQTWTPVTGDTDEIAPEDGVMLYLFDDLDDTVSSGGVAITTPGVGTLQEDRTLSGLGPGRFVLVGNPFLRAYDLSALSLDANGFQEAVQVYDPATDSYRTLTPGVDDVAAMQGFVLERKTAGSGATSLTFPSDGVRSGEGTLIKTDAAASTADEQARSARTVDLRLTVEAEGGTTVRDRARVLFREEAEVGWDAYEATQFSMPGDAPRATLTSPTNRNGTLVKRTQVAAPVPDPGQRLPLSVASDGASGPATIALPEAPDGWTVEIEDTVTGERTDLRTGAYTFALSAGDGDISAPGEARFVLHVAPSAPPAEAAPRSFAAEVDGGGALLSWKAKSADDTKGFEVHRMVGPPGTGMFETVGFVENEGPTATIQAYRFHTDPLPPGTHRFRLKQVGANGSGTYSDTATVQVALSGAYRLVAPSPNPTDGRAQMRLTVKKTQPVTVAVYDVLGRRVQTAFDRTLSAQTEQAIPVGEGLPSGTYLVRVRGEQFTATERLTIAK